MVGVEEVRGLVEEMRVLKEETLKQLAAERAAIEAERTAVEAARAEAFAMIESIKKQQEELREQMQQQHQTPAPLSSPSTSLKRKRSEAEDEIPETDTGLRDVDDDVPMANLAVSEPEPRLRRAHTEPIPILTHGNYHDRRPYKRARRLASVAVQTATAVTVGAIATWGALAFS